MQKTELTEEEKTIIKIALKKEIEYFKGMKKYWKKEIKKTESIINKLNF